MANTYTKNIHIRLENGTPEGIREIKLSTNNNFKLFDVPRSEIISFCKQIKQEDIRKGIYFFEGNNQLYIGQTQDLLQRLIHWNNKELTFYWQHVFVVQFSNHDLTGDHLLYLEAIAIRQVKEAGRFELVNGTDGSTDKIISNFSNLIKDDCKQYFEDLKTLLAVLNQNFFTAVEQNRLSETPTISKVPEIPATSEPRTVQKSVTAYAKPSSPAEPRQNNAVRSLNENEVNKVDVSKIYRINSELPDKAVRQMFYFQKARGFYDENGKAFTLCAGSLVCKAEKDYISSRAHKIRKELISQGVLIAHDEQYWKLTKEQTFSAPSTAAEVVSGSSKNGWIEWKNQKGQTLDEVYRSSSELPDKVERQIFYFQKARGFYDEDSKAFILCVGSLVRKVQKKIHPSVCEKRQELISQGVLVEYDEQYWQLTAEQAFSAPSTAAQVVSGSSVSGLIVWRNAKGQILKEAYPNLDKKKNKQ